MEDEIREGGTIRVTEVDEEFDKTLLSELEIVMSCEGLVVGTIEDLRIEDGWLVGTLCMMKES